MRSKADYTASLV